MVQPKVSIIIPVYNGSNYLKGAIQSALAQTYKNLEVIVINDGSDDNGKTQAIIKGYGDRIKAYYQENAGVAAALNLGIDMMTGEYFSWLSHDDLYLPNKIASQMAKIMETGNKNTIIYSGYKSVNQKGQEIGIFQPNTMYPLDVYNHPLFPVFRLLVNGCTVLFHKDHFKRVGGFDIHLKTTQDYDMWYKLFKDQVVIYCPTIAVISRQHEGQMSKTTIDFHVQECEKLWLSMLGSLSLEELDVIDDNAYAFFIKTHQYLKQRTLYYQTIQYAMVEALKQLRRLLLKGYAYEQIVTAQTEVFDQDLKIHQILNNKDILTKNKPRIAFFIYSKTSEGGLMKMLKTIAKALTQDYEVCIFYSKNEGRTYEKEDHIAYIPIETKGQWEYRLVKYMVVLGIDVIIGCHNCLPYFINLYTILKAYNIKCIAWNHEDYLFTQVNKLYNNIGESRKVVFHNLDAVVWINEFSQLTYAQEATNGVYIPDCIEAEANSISLNQKEPYSFIAVGRYEDTIKRLDKLLEVFAMISANHQGAKLYIVGNVRLDSKLEVLNGRTVAQYMASLNIAQNRIIFTGWLADVSPYYAKAMIQLCTSEREGFSLVILEAASYGVPTIAISNGGADTIITSGKDGYIVNNTGEMANCALMLLQNVASYEMLSKQSKLLCKEYTVAKTMPKWYTLLDRVIGERSYLARSNDTPKLVKSPLVSIIIPVFNGGNYLREAIISALEQTYSNIEILVINDGSTDDGQTREIVLSFGDRIRYYEKPNGGVASALNYGINQMKGEYFSWLSHDDRYKPNKIMDQVKHLNKLEDEATIIYGGYDLIDEVGKIYYQVNPGNNWSKEQLERPLFPVFKGLINGCSLLIHKSHFDRVGKFNEQLKAAQDIDLWFRMFQGAKIYYQDEINVETRIHQKRGSLKATSIEEVNEGWIERMHKVTIQEMRETMGSPYLFYQGIVEALQGMSNYKAAYDEALRLAQIYKDEEKLPLVSVIIPFYNRIELVKECLTSVINQTYSNLEIILINDGSEETIDGLKAFIAQDKRIRLLEIPHGGSAAARNKGIEEAKGSYIAFLDSDDLFVPDKIEKQLQYMLTNQLLFSHTSYQRLYMEEDLLKNMDSAIMSGRVFPEIIYLCLIATSTVMVKKAALGDRRFITDIQVAEDICFWIDLTYEYELGGLTEYLSIVRVTKQTTFWDKEKVKRGYINTLNHIFANEKYLKEHEAISKQLTNFATLFKD